MRFMALFSLVLLVLACASDKDDTQSKPDISRFVVSDPSIIQALDAKLEEDDGDVVIHEEEISLNLGEPGKIIYAVHNPYNLSDICIYSQFRCTTVLTGESCDSEVREKDTFYFWKWFRPAGKTLIMNTTTAYFQADISEDNAENVFLGELVIWYVSPMEGECPDIDQFSEREGIKRFGKASFVLKIK